MIIYALAGAGLLTATAAQAAVFAWNTMVPYFVAIITGQKMPPGSDAMKAVFAQVLDTILRTRGVIGVTLDSSNLYRDTSQILASSAGTAPQGGIVYAPSQTGAPSNTTAVTGYQVQNGTPTSTEYAAPTTPESESTTAATIAPILEDGTYAGTTYGSLSSITTCYLMPNQQWSCNTSTATFWTDQYEYPYDSEVDTIADFEQDMCSDVQSLSNGAPCSCTVNSTTSLTCSAHESVGAVNSANETISPATYTATLTVTKQ